jgi:(p)ppGpp synthase/HD superfamily hydrolase
VGNILEAAKQLALEKHLNQTYDIHPYEYHLNGVAELAKRYGEEAEIISWLHDIVEDTDTTLEELEKKFGYRIAFLVDILTDQQGPNRKTRKTRTNYKLKNVLPEYYTALTVKACDRLFNVSYSLETNNISKMKMYKSEHEDFYNAAFRQGICDEIWDTLTTKILSIM